jgi:ABC-type polysaccharide/polyol phosphate export permease
MEAMMWFLFVTSGIYESFVDLQPLIGDYYRWNPVMVVIEYGRLALNPGYPVGDLNLEYPVAVAALLVALGLLLRQIRTRAPRR